jgi:rod shape-determining protein MreD
MRTVSFHALVSFLLIAVQATLVNLVTIGPAVPDLLLIWIVYIGITTGQLRGTLFGFFIGLLLDTIGGGMLGLSALTKTLAGFFAGYFYDENRTEQTLSTWKFVIIAGIISLLHNAIYFVIFLQGTSISWWRSLSLHGIPSALYTIILAILPMVVFRRKYQ